MKKIYFALAVLCLMWGFAFPPDALANEKFAIVLQAGKESHEGMARAFHAFLYAKEFSEKGYEVVLIFDGAGTEWVEELSDPDSASPLKSTYDDFRENGLLQVICDYCAASFNVKGELIKRNITLSSEYLGHPSIAHWVEEGYRLIIL